MWSTVPFTSNTSIAVYSNDKRIAEVSYDIYTYTIKASVKYFGIMSLNIGIYRTTGGAPLTIYSEVYTYNCCATVGHLLHTK